MTKGERIDAEISVAFDLVRFLMDHPAVLKDIADGAVVEVVGGDRRVPARARSGQVVTFVARRTFRRVA